MVAELPVTEAEAPRDEGQVNVQVSQLARRNRFISLILKNLVNYLTIDRVLMFYLKNRSPLQFPVENCPAHASEGDEDKMPGNVKDGEDRQDHQPEPEEDVDLLVDDVDGEDTLDVVSLNRTARTVPETTMMMTLVIVMATYLWKVHLVTLGKTRDMGSILSSSDSIISSTVVRPYLANSPPRKQLVKNIWPITLTR